MIGLLGLDQVKPLSPEERARTRVRQLMLPISDRLRVAPGDSLWSALEKLTQNGLGRVAVIDHDTLAGYLSIKDVLHVLAVKSKSSPSGDLATPTRAIPPGAANRSPGG